MPQHHLQRLRKFQHSAHAPSFTTLPPNGKRPQADAARGLFSLHSLSQAAYFFFAGAAL